VNISNCIAELYRSRLLQQILTKPSLWHYQQDKEVTFIKYKNTGVSHGYWNSFLSYITPSDVFFFTPVCYKPLESPGSRVLQAVPFVDFVKLIPVNTII